jgi:hypothetical protein
MITWSYSLLAEPDPTTGSGTQTLTGNVGTSYACLALDESTGDLARPVRILRGAPAIVQRIRVRFQWWLGEWFLDRREGVPYRRDILIKNPDPILVSGIFRKVLMQTPGVQRVESLDAILVPVTRTLSVDFRAILFDSSIVIADAEPFILG